MRWRHQGDAPAGGLSAKLDIDVLVVDDEDSVRTTICEILGTAGITTDQASDGLAALEKLEESHVGAMVLDIRMPRLDGLATLQRLDHPPPTVLVSAFEIDAEVREHLGTKVLFYLQKPFRPKELLNAVASALGRPDQ